MSEVTPPEVAPLEVTLLERPDDIRIVRILSPEGATPYRASFVGAYQTIFSMPPYNERFTPEEAKGVLHRSLHTPEHLTLLAIKGKRQVVGFGFAVPVMARRDITRELSGLIPLRHSFYLAELGVLESARGTGLGSMLVRQRLENIDTDRYTHVVLRTSATKTTSYNMYLRLGFDDMGVYMEVPSLRQDGRETTDRRLFLSRVLGAPDLID
ncbi:MAG: GNAT family N-acetyltransferase [Myxococcota bacterium]|nr:GNAT family N-acetyltransferase [Myxococcota bacterium]